MKKILFPLLLISSLLGQTIHAQQARKVVFIIVDGISFDQLQNANTPNLDRIANEGSILKAYVGGTPKTYTETPTISAVGYNSLLTGTWVNKHNVYGNDIKAPNYNYPTIFKLFKEANPKGTTAIFSSWEDNRTKLVGEGLTETGKIKIDYSFDGLEHDTINYPHDKQRNFMKMIDLNVALKASETIENIGPDLSWVYLEYSDDMGHAFGDSPRFNAAIAFEDNLIGKIYKAIENRKKTHNEDWLFIVTTDHGRSATDGKHHGSQSDRERSTWIVSNYKDINTYFKKETAAIVDILPTMTEFLKINVPQHVKREFDGVSLISPIDATALQAKIDQNNLTINWKNLSENPQAKANIYISKTNQFKTGGLDEYIFHGKVDVSKESYTTSVKNLKSGFYKIVLETPNTTLNYWIQK